MEGMLAIFTPIAICVILPIAIVWIRASKARNYDNKRAEIILKAIECQPNIDPEAITAALKQTDSDRRPKTPVELLNFRLLRGCIFTLVGIAAILLGYYQWDFIYYAAAVFMPIGLAYLIVYFATRRQVLDEAATEAMRAEESAGISIEER
ncbi:MAG: hypothetical protein K2K92_05900 [Duncaniella sp.]|nr:hypothetical protein [Duncaniella sp.]